MRRDKRRPQGHAAGMARERKRHWVPKEAAALARQGALITRHLRRSEPVHPPGTERAVVFVHGFGASAPVFDPIRHAVRTELGLATLSFAYGPWSRFDRVVERLHAFVEARVPVGAQVSLVGHSLGGVLVRAALHGLDGRGVVPVQFESVDRLVTLAAPHDGTVASKRVPGSLAGAMKPGSSVLDRLNRNQGSYAHVPHLAVVAGQDRFCVPVESAAALKHAHAIWFERVGHNEMLFHADVIDAVVRALSGAPWWETNPKR